MNAIPTFEGFAQATTSADFAALIDRLGNQIIDAETAEIDLEKALETAIFTGGDIGAARTSLAQTRSHLDELRLALRGAQERRETASQREKDGYLDEIEVQNAKDVETLRSAYEREGQLFDELRRVLLENEVVSRRVEARNQELAGNGRQKAWVNVKDLRRKAIGTVRPPERNIDRRHIRREVITREEFLHSMHSGHRQWFDRPANNAFGGHQATISHSARS